MPSPVNGSKKSAASPTRATPGAQARRACDANGPVAIAAVTRRACATRGASCGRARSHCSRNAEGLPFISQDIDDTRTLTHLCSRLACGIEKNRIENGSLDGEPAISKRAVAMLRYEIALNERAIWCADDHSREMCCTRLFDRVEHSEVM